MCNLLLVLYVNTSPVESGRCRRTSEATFFKRISMVCDDEILDADDDHDIPVDDDDADHDDAVHDNADHDNADHDDADRDTHLLQLCGGSSKESTLRSGLPSLSHARLIKQFISRLLVILRIILYSLI